MEAALNIAKEENIHGEDLSLLETAAAYHDCGFLRTYSRHEEVGCEIAEQILPRYGYSEDQIRRIKEMIMATKVPQSPGNHLAKVLCDADLDYLGGDDYDEISQKLYAELLENGFELDRHKWMRIQVKFLQEHHYWTAYSVKHRTPGKLKVLEQLKAELASGHPPL